MAELLTCREQGAIAAPFGGGCKQSDLRARGSSLPSLDQYGEIRVIRVGLSERPGEAAA